MEWFQIQVLVSDESFKEAISSYFFDLGAEGISETVDKGVSQGLCACFPTQRQTEIESRFKEYLDSIQAISPQPAQISWSINPVSKENWAEKYKEFYLAQKLTHRFFLRPRWDTETKIPNDMYPILLDPGQAFGTGLHQSTRLSMKLMEDVAGLFPALEPVSLLDVGTGSGILAIAAHHLGFGKIVAIDNDLDAVRVAQENMKFNGAEKVQVAGTLISELNAPFDIVVSNILLETHTQLAMHYQRLLKPGGLLILSGLLGGQLNFLEPELKKLRFDFQQSYLLQEWAAFSYVLRPLP